MKKILVVCLLLTVAYNMCAQTIKGRILKAGSDTAVANAIVYYGGSIAGTIANEDGTFELIAKAKQIPITVSCVGYISSTVYYQPGKPLIVYLKPKPQDLHEVVIRADGMSHKEEVAIFYREFIGTSDYAKSCTITNIDDVSLFYDRKKGELTAYCDKPIIIQNKKLGYIITYYLDSFVYTYTDMRYTGNFIFKEIPAASLDEQVKIIANREDAYTGSRMQFVRALWQGSFDKAGFSVYDQAPANGFYGSNARYSSVSNGAILRAKDILVRDSLQNLYVHLADKVFIYYKSMSKASELSSAETYSYIDQNGFYSAGLRWAGPMSSQRMGDLLPYEYQPPVAMAKVQPVKSAPDSKKMNPLNPYVITENTKGTATNKDAKLLKTILLTNDSPVGPVVRKWDRSVNYKIYGGTGIQNVDQMLADDIKRLFSRVAEMSGLVIAPAATDSAVNFFIFLTGSPKEYVGILPADVKGYFKANQNSAGYYTYGDEGFHKMVKFAHLEIIEDPFRNYFELKYRLFQHILNGMGFFGNVRGYKGSVFNYETAGGGAKPDDKRFDDFVIKSLYKPAVKSGMTEPELDAVLKNVK